ncbi:MAG: dTDP-4-dehydrorhamnose reductase [Candidatus Ranarchaeia archaeon]|jgi:dTDP-4-dehydrorhamnose reductase
MENLLIVGSTGLLGSYLWKEAQSRYKITGIHFGETQNPEDSILLDITNLSKLKDYFHKNSPDHVILTSAMTHVDQAEINPQLAYKLNAEAPKNIAQLCVERGASLIYVSTDFVFDGKKNTYFETDIPNPLSVYGKTKYEGEVFVKQYNPKAVIARSCVLYGMNPPERRHNYVTWVLSNLKEDKPIRIVTDQYNTPTYAGDLASMLLKLLETKVSGLYHTCGRECLSRFDFAIKIAEVFDLSSKLISPILSKDFSQKAERPKRACLSTEKLQAELNFTPKDIREGLDELRKELSYNNSSVNPNTT